MVTGAAIYTRVNRCLYWLNTASHGPAEVLFAMLLPALGFRTFKPVAHLPFRLPMPSEKSVRLDRGVFSRSST
jgi:hypothetical protein